MAFAMGVLSSAKIWVLPASAPFAPPATNVNVDYVTNLSENDVYNDEIDSTDAIECSSKYDSSNVDNSDNGSGERQGCETKFLSLIHI